ncbi:hypothetical protein K1719_012841 [Acacia pycnantha]|nr:hypothetical protein K1719_012841 [Acacia pycnantha]
MAALSSTVLSSSFLSHGRNILGHHSPNQKHLLPQNHKRRVEIPKVEPQLNTRACMIGIIGVFIVELIRNKEILQVIGVDVGKGLDLPL